MDDQRSPPGDHKRGAADNGVTQPDIYDPSFVGRLFDEMARTYGIVNLVSSFGFTIRWRRQCLRSIEVAPADSVLDLMTGMGELCPDLLQMVGASGKVRAVDISPVMCERARQRAPSNDQRLHVIQADALSCPIEDASVDCVVSTFGLKTFNLSQWASLANEVSRVLRPGGQFSFLEISVPRGRLLRWPYLFYLNHVIPMIGRVALGNPDNYRYLGVYTVAFQDCNRAARCFADAGLLVQHHSYFFGCATGISGFKPATESA